MTLLLWDVDRIPWASLRAFRGERAAQVPDALRQLASATTDDAARDAALHIDNHVVSQGELFEAAEYVVPFALQILMSGSPPAQRYTLDLLIELTGPAAYTAAEEEAVGNGNLLEHCRARAREGLAIGYWLLASEQPWIRRSAVEFLDAIETDVERWRWMLQRFIETERDPPVRDLALQVMQERGW